MISGSTEANISVRPELSQGLCSSPLGSSAEEGPEVYISAPLGSRTLTELG